MLGEPCAGDVGGYDVGGGADGGQAFLDPAEGRAGAGGKARAAPASSPGLPVLQWLAEVLRISRIAESLVEACRAPSGQGTEAASVDSGDGFEGRHERGPDTLSPAVPERTLLLALVVAVAVVPVVAGVVTVAISAQHRAEPDGY